MKKHILLFIIVLFSANIQAQKDFGVFIGTNYSYLTDGFQKEIYAEDSFGLQIGILYELSLSDRISFRPKLSYSQQGDRIRTNQNNGSSSIDLSQIDSKLNYLNMSLDFKFWKKIYIITGPQIGYLLSQKKLSSNLVFIGKKTDFGLNFGGGFQVYKLFFELGFYQGLTKLTELSSRNTDVRNSHFKFTLGYNF